MDYILGLYSVISVGWLGPTPKAVLAAVPGVPPSFGEQVEVIVLPIYGQEKTSDFFECVGEDMAEYRLNDWTDKEFNQQSMKCACGDDETEGKDIFFDTTDDADVDWELQFGLKKAGSACANADRSASEDNESELKLKR